MWVIIIFIEFLFTVHNLLLSNQIKQIIQSCNVYEQTGGKIKRFGVKLNTLKA